LKLPLITINHLSQDSFVKHFGQVVEHSAWVAEKACERRPFASIEQVKQVFVSIVQDAGEESWRYILNLHPELSGKEAEEGTLTKFSVSEQMRIGLHTLNRHGVLQVREFNQQYRDKFGFPFVVCVRLLKDMEQLFAEMDRRLASEPAQELLNGIEQVYAIGGFRIDDLILPESN
jgi:2-oxo-4-hydroxy-4-carboxy-5-ureidoimidazoline decarboxylase